MNNFKKGFQMLGKALVVTEELNKICEDFDSQLYDSKYHSASNLYYHSFCDKKLDIESH